MSAITLSSPTFSYDGKTTLASCEVSIPGQASQQLWIQTSGEGIVRTSDSFVALSLLPAMKLGVPLVSEGPVSRTLLESGLPRIQHFYAIWRYDKQNAQYPRYREVPIEAPAVEDVPSASGVGLLFSGGVDSSFSLVEAREEITDLIFIHDFEDPFPPDQAVKAVSGVTNVAEAFGKRLITAKTNARSVFSQYVSRRVVVLPAVALQLQGRLSKVHVASSDSVKSLHPGLSHPFLDPLWSTTATEIVHDRIDVTRLEKTALIAGDRLLLENLRVCWEPYQNCGHCDKCVRTIFALMALDRFEEGVPFNRPPLTPRDISRLNLRDEYEWYYEEIADYLNETGRYPELVKAAQTAHSGWYHYGFGRLFRGNLSARLKARAERRLRRLKAASRTPRATRPTREG